MSQDDRQRSLDPRTLAAQALGRIDGPTRALVPPIHTSTTFLRDADGGYSSGYGYTRADNPTNEPPEDLLARLEGGESALLFASGSAAASAVFSALLPGDHVVASRIMYWGLRKWIVDFSVPMGIATSFVDTTDLDAVRAAIRPGQTRLVWLETPGNPTWEVSDIAAAADLAHRVGARAVVDSTAATPVLTRPLALGADLVVHSATKFLNGHGDVLAGALVTARRDGFWQRIRAVLRDGGAMLGPFEAWLLLRGMRTLFPRVEIGSAHALSLARHLEAHPAVERVLYPGLESHAQHALAARQMQGGFGPMLSFQVRGENPDHADARASATAANVHVFKRATSLGGVESLIEHRASIEGPATRVPRNLLRVSVGIEALDDLIADLDAALDAAQAISDQGPRAVSVPVPDPDATRAHAALLHDIDTRVRTVVQARGGDVRIEVRPDDDPERAPRVRLEVLGSPGAFHGIRSHIEAELRALGVAFEIDADESAPGEDHGASSDAASIDAALAQVRRAIAAHDGTIDLVSYRDGVAEVALGGRCQGCTLSEVTLRQGVEVVLRERVPGFSRLVDVTDHDAGRDPYFAPSKSSHASH